MHCIAKSPLTAPTNEFVGAVSVFSRRFIQLDMPTKKAHQTADVTSADISADLSIDVATIRGTEILINGNMNTQFLQKFIQYV